MKKIKDLKLANNTNNNLDDFQKPANLNRLTAPVINEKKIKLFRNLVSEHVKDSEKFRKELVSELKTYLADFLETSESYIDDSAFDIPQISIENISTLSLELRERLEQTLAYKFSNALQYHDAYKKNLEPYIANELEKIDQINYDELYKKTYTDYYNRYLSEGDPRAKFHAEKITELCVRAEKSAMKSMIKNTYKRLDIKNILKDCYDTIVEQHTEGQKQDNDNAEKSLGTIFQN